MALLVAYRQAARREITDAAGRYEGERRGLAATFLAEVVRIEAAISEAPQLYQAVGRGGDAQRCGAFHMGSSIWKRTTGSWF